MNSRNGCRRREWDTRAGTVELAIPEPAAVVNVTGGSNKRVSLAALICVKPGQRSRPTDPGRPDGMEVDSATRPLQFTAIVCESIDNDVILC